MIFQNLFEAYGYWTKTPNVLNNALDAVGFAVRNPVTAVIGVRAPDLSGDTPNGVSFKDGSPAEVIANNSLAKVANMLSLTKKTTVIRDGEFVRQNHLLNEAGIINDAIDDTITSVFQSETFWKYAIMAGGAFALYKFGGEFIAGKGAKLARR